MLCFSISPPHWRTPHGQMWGNSLMGLIGGAQLNSHQSIMLNSHQSIKLNTTTRRQRPLFLSVFRVSRDWPSFFRNWIQCRLRGMFTVTTLDDVPDKNAAGLWELKSCHLRCMKASVTRQASIASKNETFFSPLQELLQVIKKRGQKMTRMLRMLSYVSTVSPWGLRRRWRG